MRCVEDGVRMGTATWVYVYRIRPTEESGKSWTCVTPLSQTRGGMWPVCVDRLHSASTLTQCRSTPCPHTNETPHTTPKLDGAVIVRRTSASRVTVGRPNTPPKPSSKLFMTWGCLKTSSPRLKDA